MRTALRITWFSLMLPAWIAVCSPAKAQALTLEEILSRMDRRGADLQSMTASIVQRKWTDVLEEFDAGEKGRLAFLKKSGKVYLRKDINTPQDNTLVISDGKVTFYQPRIKQAQRYNLGQNRDKAEFLLLGFGSDKEAMKQTYRIRLLGKETVGGHDTYVLELTPRSDKISAFFSQIVLWFDSQLWVPIQQKLVEPTRDYLLVEFTDLQLNAKVTESLFQLKLPKDVKVLGN